MQQYVSRAELFLSQAWDELNKQDLCQASEKGWGAAAQMVKAVATTRGWRHDSHRQLLLSVKMLARESGNLDLWAPFGGAQMLHANFYDDFMDAEDVLAHLEHASSFVEKLKGLVEPST